MPGTTEEGQVMLSRLVAFVMAFVYTAFLVFQVRTHADLFSGGEAREEEEPMLGVSTSVVMVCSAICAVAFCSEFLVYSIEGVSGQFGVTHAFIGSSYYQSLAMPRSFSLQWR